MGNQIELTRPSFRFAVVIAFIFFSCGENTSKLSCPTVTIIKLESALFFNDYEAARSFIDLNSVYGEIAKTENTTVDSIWFRVLNFNNSIGNSSPKFRSLLPFHKYRIIEHTYGNKSTIELDPINKSSKKITYSLNLENAQWIIVQIKYG